MEITSSDAIFLAALTTEGLERFDITHEAVVNMYEAHDYAGIDRLMLLALGTASRGWVRSLMMSVRPVKDSVTVEIYERLGEFLRKGNRERQQNEAWIRSKPSAMDRDYEALYAHIRKSPEHVSLGLVDYETTAIDSPAIRDVVRVRRWKEYDITFSVRGYEYGAVRDSIENDPKTEKERFVEECQRLRLAFMLVGSM